MSVTQNDLRNIARDAAGRAIAERGALAEHVFKVTRIVLVSLAGHEPDTSREELEAVAATNANAALNMIAGE